MRISKLIDLSNPKYSSGTTSIKDFAGQTIFISKFRPVKTEDGSSKYEMDFTAADGAAHTVRTSSKQICAELSDIYSKAPGGVPGDFSSDPIECTVTVEQHGSFKAYKLS